MSKQSRARRCSTVQKCFVIYQKHSYEKQGLHTLFLFPTRTHTVMVVTQPLGWKAMEGRLPRKMLTLTQGEIQKSETSDAHLFKNLTANRFQTANQFNFSAVSVSDREHGPTEGWDRKQTQVAMRRGGGRRMRGMQGRKKQINLFKRYLQLVWSLVEKVSECGRMRRSEKDGEVGGEGVRTYTTEGGRGSLWVIGRCRGGEGTKRVERRDGKEGWSRRAGVMWIWVLLGVQKANCTVTTQHALLPFTFTVLSYVKLLRAARTSAHYWYLQEALVTWRFCPSKLIQETFICSSCQVQAALPYSWRASVCVCGWQAEAVTTKKPQGGYILAQTAENKAPCRGTLEI